MEDYNLLALWMREAKEVNLLEGNIEANAI